MNNIYIICVILILMLSSCKKNFLQKPITSSTTIDSIFSSTTNALTAVSQAYEECLAQGIPRSTNSKSFTEENLSGALLYGNAFSNAMYIASASGMTASSYNEDFEGFVYNYTAIRQAYLVKENIDKVSDMSSSDKAIVKAEMLSLIAYRYEQMLIMYGGVPIVSKALNSEDDLMIPRSSVREVLDSIVSWCNASAELLPSEWPSKWTGRITKAGALSIKAKALLYAARPLFNTATPYISDAQCPAYLLCLGNYSQKRWDTAAAAAISVISEAETNESRQIINTGNPLADYGNATSTPDNEEIILSYNDESSALIQYLDPHNNYAYASGLTSNFLANYRKADGSDQSWPAVGTYYSFADYLSRMNEMEPRFKASFWIFETDAWNNPNDTYWINTKLYESLVSYCALPTKFFYKASTRAWLHFPIFRLAAFYLSAAEAYNEVGNFSQALKYLNVIHERAGFPDITVTDQDSLRNLIHREWAVEFFDENYYLHDIKHWKLTNIGNGLIGGSIRTFTFNNGKGAKVSGNTNYSDRVAYTGYWADREYLCPFPTAEINKGYLIQNPGY